MRLLSLASRSRRTVLAIGIGATVLVIGMVVASPWLLCLVVGGGSSWTNVGNVGQAYGGAAAILAALAFMGIGVSVVVQWHAADLQRAAIARERHFELTKLSIEHVALRRLGKGMERFTDEEALIC